ncbi:AAA family ATPase [Streptomyces sp. SCUT-3]|uniref:AAA family ATPase n=1 Tax=Streptomyces sp. SCUT-3 TaxID=2684469 RepID=UPI0015FCF30B|nr:SMC family ATPase [Streptomyces sp. SCUT-3]QMV20638.1 AAA family ATPase [Streptomyces sp. SCUT-3]
MRLHRLTVQAFGPFPGTETVDFDALSSAGLFLLHGPTGAGKTSVLDAVCYALYAGLPGARQGAGARLRSDHADPGTPTEVVLELTLAGRRLEVTRRPEQERPKKRGTGTTRDKAVSHLREYDPRTGNWRALSRSHQEIGEEIGNLLGMSREQFCQVVLLPQGEFAAFLRADAGRRAELLGRLFDTARFRDVERWLADRRKEAEGRVRVGDEQLLALAHRARQAAGEGAEPLEDRLPEEARAAGHPDLAPHVLQWAAVLRADARERRTAAAVALAAAEAAHTGARRALEDAQELAGRQERHRRARQRADELDRQREQYEADAVRLERAGAAARVAPALALRERAAHEHTAACAAERAARAALDPSHAQAGAEELAGLERARRQDLGGLRSALSAERRHAEVGAELDRLDREARDDEERLAEAAQWQAGWEEAARAHRRRIDEAQEAAALAEQLAARLGTARRRLAAARRRDALRGRTAEAQDRCRAALDAELAARGRWQDLREQRLEAVAAELAAELADGRACMVCGSVRHPAPAAPGPRPVTKEHEDAAQAAYDAARAEREKAEREAAALHQALADAAAEAADGTPGRGEDDAAAGVAAGVPADATAGTAVHSGPAVAELAAAERELEQELTAARAAARELHAAREALARAEAEHARRTGVHRDVEQRAAARTSRRELLEREHAGLAEEIARARAGAAGIGERIARLTREADLLARAAGAARAADEAARRLKEADAAVDAAAFRAGFRTAGEAAAAALPDADHNRLQARLEQWRAERAAVTEELASPGLADAAAAPPADPGAARAAWEAAADRLRAASTADAAARSRCEQLDRLGEQAEAATRRLAPAREEFARLHRLAQLTAGTAGDNELRMRLESYVLAARLEQVAAAASVRLRRMSSGRYTLVHTDERVTGRGRSGLGLRVVDAWTGAERDTSTLSGGETFFASLALALGLADVVTDEAGGLRLDTLFIDEGFGSLDEEALDEVLDVLDSLRERDRAVGIVSHVADLRRRIPVRLRVVKGRDGSVIRLRGAAGTESGGT